MCRDRAPARPAAVLLAVLLAAPAAALDQNLDELLGARRPAGLRPEERLVGPAERVRRQAESSGDGPEDDVPQEGRPAGQSTILNERSFGSLDCAFGGDRQTLCEYSNPNMSVLTWLASTGASGNWLGGPLTDADGGEDGGYAVFETSSVTELSNGINIESAMLESPLRPAIPPGGQCIQFQYSMWGLSVDRLRILLHPVDEAEKLGGFADHRDDFVLWTSAETGGDDWQQGRQLYSFSGEHTIVFEAIPHKDSRRQFRGHVAVDSIRAVGSNDCPGHCTFDGGLCTWTQDDQDDFQWKISRGSLSRKTGPRTDHGSALLGGTAGGYVFADSSFPRRPGDRARLLSAQLEPTVGGEPLCFRFWTYLFGPGVGTLRVLRLVGDQRTELWRLSGPFGRRWHQAQVPVSSAERFTLALEAELGPERFGDIAIDDVSLRPGICPAAPQAAAVAPTSCTFEVDDCGWTNARGRRGRRDWERLTAREAALPQLDHTLRSPAGFLMRLAYSEPQRAGDTGVLVSPPLAGGEQARCLTFRYYMDEIVSTFSGPRLGSLKVWVSYEDDDGEQTMHLWRLYNAQGPKWLLAQVPYTVNNDHKIVFEGMWGGSSQGVIALDDITVLDGDCPLQPAQAAAAEGDCAFTLDACGWRNSTSDERSRQRWRLATEIARPSLLIDHTFRMPTGYVYFDVFSPQQQELLLRLQSPLLQLAGDDGRGCVSFWYAALSLSRSARLRVLHEAASDEQNEADGAASAAETAIWELRASDVAGPRLSWRYGEADFSTAQPFRIVFEGVASNLGMTLDDVSFRSGTCRVHPPEAQPQDSQDDDSLDRAQPLL